MKLVFWFSLATIVYTYCGYPLFVALLAKLKQNPWQKALWPTQSRAAPISVVMAVHNGGAMLQDKIAHLLSLDPELISEVIVVSDGSIDRTNAILRASGHPRLRSIILPDHSGKAVALNHGVAAATGNILLFVDIRPHIEHGSLIHLLANFADPCVGCVAGELVLETAGHDAATASVSGLYWRYEQWIRNCEAAWDSPVGVYGGFYAIRRFLAKPVPPGTILDDMFQPLSIIRQGYRSVLDREAVVTDRWPQTTAGEFSRKVRTLAGNFQLLTIAPWIMTPANRVVFQLISHKILRLVVPYFFFTLLISASILGAASKAFLVFAIMQSAFWFLGLISLKVRVPVLGRLASPIGALLVLNAAAVAGLFTFLFTKGPLWKIWVPTSVHYVNQQEI